MIILMMIRHILYSRCVGKKIEDRHEGRKIKARRYRGA